MSLTFRPVISKQSIEFVLPGPASKVLINDVWNPETGPQKTGTQIVLEGSVGSHEGELLLTEDQMLAEIESLRAACDVNNDLDKYSLYLYHDATAELYRRFANCQTTKLEFDLSNKNLFTFSMIVETDDPTLYTTAA